MTKRRTYTREFKEEAVRLAEERGYTQAGRDLGVDRSLIRKWKNKLAGEAENGQRAFPGKGNPRDEELVRLRRELRRAQEEVEILKKAVGIFTSRPRSAV